MFFPLAAPTFEGKKNPSISRWGDEGFYFEIMAVLMI